VDSAYYFESELFGGEVSASFSKYLPWQAMHFLQRSTHFLKSDADRWSLRNFLPRSSFFMVGKVQKLHGTRSELNSVFGLEKMDRRNPIRISAIQSRSRPMRFLGFSNYEKGAPGQEISKWSMVCSTFSRSEWSVVRREVLRKRDRHRTSTKFRLGVIRWVHDELLKCPSYFPPAYTTFPK
jgi:hypothetical protein